VSTLAAGYQSLGNAMLVGCAGVVSFRAHGGKDEEVVRIGPRGFSALACVPSKTALLKVSK